MDLRFADPLDLDQMAAEAGFSKFHFARAFKDAFGETPANYLTRRRVERAKDLLRSANLTVTEVCMLVGFSSLGSFSSRFTELVGMPPSRFQPRVGGPRRTTGDSGVLPDGLESSSPDGVGSGPGSALTATTESAISEKRAAGRPSYPDGMINRMSHTSVFVLDQDSAKTFYTEKLGFEVRFDISMGEEFEGAGAGFRWLTVGPKDQPDLQIILSSCDMGRSPEAAAQFRDLVAGGSMGVGVMTTDDCRQTYEALVAEGVTFLSEPAERPYGIEATLRDDSGNMMSLVQPLAFDGVSA